MNDSRIIPVEYMHVDVDCSQNSKDNQRICGDFILQHKTSEASTIIVADGIGSGIKANIAATMITTQLIKMLEEGFSLREAVVKIVSYLHKARTMDIPFAAFTIARILSNGITSIITYESPPPVFIENNIGLIAKQNFFSIKNEVLGESNFKMDYNKSIILVTDGITQAGMGKVYPMGWQIEGLKNFINKTLSLQGNSNDITSIINDKAKALCMGKNEDDSTVVKITCRKGKILNIFTGPPTDKAMDEIIFKKFIQSDGLKIICGSTTIEVFARVTNKEIIAGKISGSYAAPPRYYLKGVDIATEGTVVLNQIYNIVDENQETYDTDSCVTELAVLLNASDLIRFWIGQADNPGHKSILFRQMGLLPRRKIIPLLMDKLKKMGKLVIAEYY